MQQKDYREFKERMEGMPARLPPVEANGEWSEMMNKSGVGFSYRAWRHVLPYGGTEYLSRTVFENATVEEMCDFFNDDDVFFLLRMRRGVVGSLGGGGGEDTRAAKKAIPQRKRESLI